MSDKRIEIVERIIDRLDRSKYYKEDPSLYEFVDLAFEYLKDEDKTVEYMNEFTRLVEKSWEEKE